jgi:hypothetical protein
VPDDLRSLLRGWLERLTLDPIDPYDPEETRYVPLQESGRGAVDEIHATIDLRIDTTTQLLSGPNGAGKTTELLRLKGKLAENGFTVAIVDILQFVNRSSPIDVTDCLLAIALGAGERLPQPEPAGGGFGRRFADFLRRFQISIDAGPVSASLSDDSLKAGMSGITVEMALKRELKNSESFVNELRKKLAFQIGSLYTEVADYFRQVVAADRVANPTSRGLVLIVDSLEKLRGTQDNDEQVQASVEKLFVHHSDKLRFESLHMVYTVPTYLLFTSPGALPYDGRVHPVPIPQVQNRNGRVEGHASKSIAELTDVVSRRIPWQELLGDEENLNTVIAASGGHLRDLFLILHQIITQVYGRGLRLPVTAKDVEDALDAIAHSFSSVTSEKAEFLRKVAAAGGVIEPTENEVHLMARLMDTHMLLAHLNHRDWYEVHPLARRALDLT